MKYFEKVGKFWFLKLLITFKYYSTGDPFSHVTETIQRSNSRPENFSDFEFGIIPRDSDPILTFSFDEQPELTNHSGPSPSLILQALTMSNSNDGKSKWLQQNAKLKHQSISSYFCLRTKAKDLGRNHLSCCCSRICYFYILYLLFISFFYYYIFLSISTHLSQPTYIPNYVYLHT